MLDVIKALIEIAAKLVGAGDKLREHRFKAVGQKLLVLYFRVNETVEGAQEVIRQMERYRQDTDWRREHGKETIYTGTTHHFSPKRVLEEQALNISRLKNALGSVRVEMALVDGSLSRRLDGLVDGKSNAVRSLTILLRYHELPLHSIPAEEIDAAVEENLAQHGFFDWRNIVEGDGTETIKVFAGSEALYRQIVDYLDSGVPQKRIEELTKLAADMREQIGKHWSLADTLPQAAQLLRDVDED